MTVKSSTFTSLTLTTQPYLDLSTSTGATVTVSSSQVTQSALTSFIRIAGATVATVKGLVFSQIDGSRLIGDPLQSGLVSLSSCQQADLDTMSVSSSNLYLGPAVIASSVATFSLTNSVFQSVYMMQSSLVVLKNLTSVSTSNVQTTNLLNNMLNRKLDINDYL